MSSVNASKKINVVTLTGQDREPLSFENALGALARLLMTAPLQQLAQTLAEISSVLHDKSWAEAESHLRKQFCSQRTIEAIIPLDNEETVNYLFSHSALYILNTLLTFSIPITTQQAYCYIIHESTKGLSFAGSQESVALPIAEIFLMIVFHTIIFFP